MTRANSASSCAVPGNVSVKLWIPACSRAARAAIAPESSRHVGDEMRAHGVFKQRPQLLRRGTKITRFACVARSRRKRGVPPRPRAWRAPALRNVEKHSMARRQGKHSFEERDRLGHAAKKQVGGESILRNALGRGAAGEKCANLRSKRKAVRGLRVIKRLDAQWVARQEKNWRGGVALAEIEQRECEHAAQFGQGIFPPLFP